MKHIAVIGLGLFGTSVAETLVQQGHYVLGIDINEQRVQMLARLLNQCVTVSNTDEETLLALGIKEYDAVVVAIGDIESNIMVVQTLQELGVKRVMAKAVSHRHGRVLQRLGVSQVIFPEHDMGVRAAHSLSGDRVIDYIELSDEYNIVEIQAPRHFVGKTLDQIDLRKNYRVSLIAIKTAQKILISPPAETAIEAQSELVMIGKNEDLTVFYD
ncbi:MAG: potassium channel family protein [Chloroflexota bacterium]|jgi:trk system potassium uptake protein TrkA